LELGIFLFTTASIPALVATQPPIQWVPGALSPEVKWPGREADHSSLSNAEVKNEWSYTSIPVCLLGVVWLSTGKTYLRFHVLPCNLLTDQVSVE
jgi:hypothetical protein